MRLISIIRQFFPAILLAAFIMTISLVSLGEFEGDSWISVRGLDKVAHMVLFGFLSLVTFRQNRLRERQLNHWWIAAMLVFYGVLTEVLQGVLSTVRHFEILDILANIIGVFLGLLIFYFLNSKKSYV